MTVQELVEALVDSDDPGAQDSLLAEQVLTLDSSAQDDLAEALKNQSDRLMRTNMQKCRRVVDLINRMAEATGSPYQRAQGLLALGNANTVVLGDYQAGLENYDLAIKIFKEHGWQVLEARTRIGRMWAYAALGDYERAFADAEKAQATFQALGEWFHLARLQSNLAAIHARLSQYPQALELFDQAKETYQKLGIEGQPHWLRLEINRANVLRYLGRFDEALQASQMAVEMHTQLGEEVAAARARQTLAITLYVLGRYNEALAALDEVRRVLLQDDRRRQTVLVELFASDCLLQLRRFNDVIEKCRQVRELFGELGTHFEVGQAILNEARAYAGLGRYIDARASLIEARQIFEEEGNRVASAEADLQTALILLAERETEKSLGIATSCVRVFREENVPVWEAQAHLVAARAALQLDRREAASEAIQNALQAGQTHNLPALTYPSHHLLAQLCLREEKTEQGLQEIDLAIQELERLCGRLMIEFRATFVEDKNRVYEDAVSLCLQLKRPWKGLEYAERAKSRALLDMLSHRLDLSVTARSGADLPIVDELTQLRRERDQLYRHLDGEGLGQRGDTEPFQTTRFESEGRVLRLEKRITDLWHTLLIRNADYARDAAMWQVRSEPVQPYLQQDTLLLVYFALGDRLIVFTVSDTDIHAIRLGVEIKQLERLLKLLWLNLRSAPGSSTKRLYNLRQNANGILKHLHDQLIAPVGNGNLDLKAYRNLAIVPHGLLHYLPFQALFDGREYLLERYQVGYLPGASFLRYVSEAAARGHTVAEVGACISLGNTNQGRLPYTVEEAADVARILGGEALLEQRATLESLRAAAPNSLVIHMATHGDFRPDNPLFSGLSLADGWLTTLDIFNLRIRASLVTLSACQTGRSVVGGGDELLGLMRSFLAAGAASLVTTLWAVEDRSTASLMHNFYSRLVAGDTKGAALRAAQLALMSELDHSHPYFWAPFFLVGDPGKL